MSKLGKQLNDVLDASQMVTRARLDSHRSEAARIRDLLEDTIADLALTGEVQDRIGQTVDDLDSLVNKMGHS